ncbi:MAG: RagB/SusD family nutrient uptake outer membrane protein [Ferruginibacter sp.]
MRNTIILFITLLLFSGCKKFLEEQPTDFVSPDGYYNTAADMETALAGVYDILGRDAIYSIRYQVELTIGTDETYKNGNQTAGSAASVCVYLHNPSNLRLTDLWHYLYFGIERANNLIANIEKPTMDETRRGQILGEALFLRAYYYFLLATNFGGVPLKLEPTTSFNNVDIARTDLKDVYERIVADMKQAETLLVDQTATRVGSGGRVSLSTVRGILARVYLHMAGAPLNDTEKYEDARDYALKVIQSGEHTLNPSFEEVFINYAQDKYDVKESIWEVEFWGNRSDSYVETGQIGYFCGPNAGDESIGWCNNTTRITGLLYKSYETDSSGTNTIRFSPDLRRDWTSVLYDYGSAASNPNKNRTAVTNIYDMGMGKWRREFETLTPKNRSYTSQNFPLLRYSDVLLMYAEAENEINPLSQQAVNAVNEVRKRAYGKLLTGSYLKGITITNGGSGYVSTTPPKVVISGGGGTDADAVAIVSSNRVTQVVITRHGKGFTSAPTISFTSTSGSGATATAVLTDPQTISSDLKPADIASKSSLREAIKKERMLELAGESLRKQDLVRWGQLVPRLQLTAADIRLNASSGRQYTSQAGDNVSERDIYLPIPEYELNLNKLLQQNPGW